jgi:hypothetical protein
LNHSTITRVSCRLMPARNTCSFPTGFARITVNYSERQTQTALTMSNMGCKLLRHDLILSGTGPAVGAPAVSEATPPLRPPQGTPRKGIGAAAGATRGDPSGQTASRTRLSPRRGVRALSVQRRRGVRGEAERLGSGGTASLFQFSPQFRVQECSA